METNENDLTPNLREQNIDGSPFTLGWVLDILNKNDSIWKEISVGRHVKEILAQNISDGKGFMSKIYKLTITLDDDKLYHVVLKVPTIDVITTKLQNAGDSNDQLKKNLLSALRIGHNRECYIYRYHSDCGMPVPAVYAAEDIIEGKQTGVILMEYLGRTGSHIPPSKSFTIEQLTNASCCLARLHAYSMSLPSSEMGKLQATKYLPETWANIFRQHAERTVKESPSMRKTYEKLKHLMSISDYARYCIYGINKELGMKPVIVHGDMWHNNIFVKKHEDGTPSQQIAAFIDWQGAHCGSVGEDLARLLCCNRADIRREAEEVVLNAYFEMFQQEINRRNLSVTHSKHQVMLAYRRLFVCQALLLLPGLQLIHGNDGKLSGKVKRIWQAQHEFMLLRARLALEDALDIVMQDIPEWLDINHKFTE